MKYVDFPKCKSVSGNKNIYNDEICWFSKNVHQIQDIKSSVLMKYVDFQKCIPVSGDKNINFDEVRWFPKMYTWFKLWKFLFWWSTLISKNVYLFQVIKISILRKYVDFQKCIPVSSYKNINFDEVVDFQKGIPVSGYKNFYFDEVRWFPEMYTCFRLLKFLSWWSTLSSRNVYLFQVTKIYISMKYVDFHKCIPVSGYKNIYFDEVRWFTSIFVKYVYFQKCIPFSGFKNIYFDEVRWFSEM